MNRFSSENAPTWLIRHRPILLRTNQVPPWGTGKRNSDIGMDEQGAIFDASHYAILGVEPSASAEEIRRAYKDLAKKYHPDRTPSAIANALMARINHAYEVLSDPARRRAYDDDQAVRTSSGDEGSVKSTTRSRRQQQSPSHYTNDAAYDRLVMQSIELVRRDYQSLLPNVTLDQLRWLIERIPVDARRSKAAIVRVAEKTFLQSDRETPGAECIINALFDLMLLMLLSLDTSNDGKGNGKGWRTVRIDHGWCAISPTDTVGPVVGTSDEAMARHPAWRGYDDVLRKTVALWEREGFDAALDGLRGAQKESNHQAPSSARSEMTFVARTVSAVFSLGLSVLVLLIAVMMRQACQAPPRRNAEAPRPATETPSYVPSHQLDTSPVEPTVYIWTTMATGCNLRAGPGTDYRVITAVQNQSACSLIARSDRGWSRVRCGPHVGFVSDSCLHHPQ